MENQVEDWPFDQAENVAAISDVSVLEGAPVLLVIHYSDDDGWAFLSGEEFSVERGKVIGMGCALEMDATLRTVADLPTGWVATRRYVGDSWERRADPELSLEAEDLDTDGDG
jgi:hypothetical protein